MKKILAGALLTVVGVLGYPGLSAAVVSSPSPSLAPATYVFGPFGTVTVNGTTTVPENFSTYSVDAGVSCVGTTFNGTNCVPQTEVGTTAVIPAGNHTNDVYTTGAATCGTAGQQDVYTGPEIMKVTGAGHGAAWIAGGIVNPLVACPTPSSTPTVTPTTSPSTSIPPSASVTPTTSATPTPSPSIPPSSSPSPVLLPVVQPSPSKTASVVPSAPSSTTPPTLPFTGSDTEGLGITGAILLIAGTAAIIATRKRTVT